MLKYGLNIVIHMIQNKKDMLIYLLFKTWCDTFVNYIITSGSISGWNLGTR